LLWPLSKHLQTIQRRAASVFKTKKDTLQKVLRFHVSKETFLLSLRIYVKVGSIVYPHGWAQKHQYPESQYLFALRPKLFSPISGLNKVRLLVEVDGNCPYFLKLDAIGEKVIQWPYKSPSGHTVLDIHPLKFWATRRSYLFTPKRLQIIVSEAIAWVAVLAPEIKNLIPTDLQLMDSSLAVHRWWHNVQICIRVACVMNSLEQNQYIGGQKPFVNYKNIVGEFDTLNLVSPLLISNWDRKEKADKSKVSTLELLVSHQKEPSLKFQSPLPHRNYVSGHENVILYS